MARETFQTPSKLDGLIEKHIVESVDEALEDLLGTPVVEAFYAYLLEIGLSRNNLAEKIKVLCSALDTTFEESSLTIQRGIARRLFSKLELPFVPVESAGLLDYINEAKKRRRV